MFRQVPRQDTRLGVDVAADPVVDDQRQRLALVNWAAAGVAGKMVPSTIQAAATAASCS